MPSSNYVIKRVTNGPIRWYQVIDSVDDELFKTFETKDKAEACVFALIQMQNEGKSILREMR